VTTELHRWFDKAGPVAQALTALAALLALAALALLLWRATRALRGKKAADTLTVVAAAMASSVAATGMWHFFSRTMHLPEWIQAVLFAFMEISVLASALRARANVARDGNAGADGLAVWVLTSASGLMSASEAASPQEALVRLGAPLVAAWLWERSMVPERRAQRAAQGAKETAVRWLFSFKRVAVRLGLATALGADLETEDANRRIDRFVRADNRAQRAGVLTRRRAGRRRDRAHARLMEQARMQADPRALYAHLGRQAILDVLARLGGDDAVIDRERARQMEGILADAIGRPQPDGARTAADPASAPAAPTASSPGRGNGGGTEPETNGAAHAGAHRHAAAAAAAAAFFADPVIPAQQPAPAANGTAHGNANGTNGTGNGNGAAVHGFTLHNWPDAGPGPIPAAPAVPANGATAAPPATPAAPEPAPLQDELPLHIPAARQPAPVPAPLPPARPTGSHRAPIPVEPVRFVAAPLPEPEPEPEPVYAYDEPEEEPAPPPPPAAPAGPPASAVIDHHLANRITNAIAASPKLPNLLKLANELGISITSMQDTLDALGGFNAVWNRIQQDRETESNGDDLTFYSA
jgi:hypothetical protein